MQQRLCAKIKNKNPYAMLITGDFNGHCEQWWPGGDSNKEAIAIDTRASDIGLSQLIAEPTNFQGNSAH